MTEEQANRFLNIQKEILHRVFITETIAIIAASLFGLGIIGIVLLFVFA